LDGNTAVVAATVAFLAVFVNAVDCNLNSDKDEEENRFLSRDDTQLAARLIVPALE
jgi:hypothetical protein